MYILVKPKSILVKLGFDFSGSNGLHISSSKSFELSVVKPGTNFDHSGHVCFSKQENIFWQIYKILEEKKAT